ncbi:MAG TPA: MFS transporter [Thermoanaerobaculia bacterium]|nr:MFS transporter [Thermoanaerobaculia bacterium]
MSAARRPYHSLEHRDFRLLGLATLISIVGTQMQNVGIDWHIYLLTHSPLALGLVGLVRVVPIIALSLWGGVVADRHDRKRVMFAAQSVMAAAALLLAIATLMHRETLWLIYVLTAVASAATAFDNPARQALIPRLVPAGDLPGALSLNLTFFHVAMIAGPAASGVVIAATSRWARGGTRGLSLIYFGNAVSFGAVLVALLFIRASGRVAATAAAPPRMRQALADGLRFVFRTPIMVSTMALDFFATLFSGAMSLLPIVSDQILHVGPAGYGWLRSAPAIGALVGSLYTALHSLPSRQGPIFLKAVAAYGAATIVYGLSRNYALTFAALAAAGLADLVSTVIRQTLRQVITPDDLRGRMTSVNMIFFMGGPQLGEAEAGFVASLFRSTALGAAFSIVSGGIATIVVAGVVALAAPIVREYDLERHLPAIEPAGEGR